MTMPPAPPGYRWPPPQPPRERHTVRTVLLSVFGGLAGLLVLLLVIGIAAGGGDDTSPATGNTVTAFPAGDGTTVAPPANTVDRGYGANDASADAKITSCRVDTIGLATGTVAITNRSSGRSDYYIEIVFTDAAGTNIGTGYATANTVQGGQRATADLFGTVTGKLAKCAITTVQRTAS